MKRVIEHKLVNWVDGMDVSMTHLRQLEDYFIDALCDNMATRLNPFNYGLLPAIRKSEPSSEFEISEQVTNRVEIRLRRCHAVTYGGYRISYEPDGSDYMMCDFSLNMEEEEQNKQNDQNWDIILSINPFKRVPVGEPDADENPPRHPDTEPAYKLSVMQSGQINPDSFGMYHLVIGRIRYRGGRMEVDGNYIPPCTTMSSHPDLLDYYERFSSYLSRIETASRNIIDKVQNQQKTSSVAVNALFTNHRTAGTQISIRLYSTAPD